MRQGDTITLLLDYQLNGVPLNDVVGIQEMELQINKQGTNKAIKKLLSDGGITRETVALSDGTTFTGYIVRLNQSETFNLGASLNCQLRIRKDNEVGSSSQTMINSDAVLSTQVI